MVLSRMPGLSASSRSKKLTWLPHCPYKTFPVHTLTTIGLNFIRISGKWVSLLHFRRLRAFTSSYSRLQSVGMFGVVLITISVTREVLLNHHASKLSTGASCAFLLKSPLHRSEHLKPSYPKELTPRPAKKIRLVDLVQIIVLPLM